jgi:hypothetical protein
MKNLKICVPFLCRQHASFIVGKKFDIDGGTINATK